jgi:hypothetical protein
VNPFGDARQLDIGTTRTELDRASLRDLLKRWSGPVLHEDRLWCASELRRTLETDTPTGATAERQ